MHRLFAALETAGSSAIWFSTSLPIETESSYYKTHMGRRSFRIPLELPPVKIRLVLGYSHWYSVDTYVQNQYT